MRMFSNVEAQGEWWLPGDPDHRVFGVLTYTPADGALLELQQRFRNHLNPLDLTAPPVICGRTPKGTEVTLFDIINRGWTNEGLFTASYLASWMLLDRTLGDPTGEIFDEMWVRIPHADSWTEQSGFNVNFQTDDSGITTAMTLDYERPPPRVLSLSSELELTFDVVTNQVPNLPSSRFELAQEVVAHVRLRNGIPIEDFIRRFHSIQFLMSFGLGRLILPSQVEVLEANGEPEDLRATTPRVKVFFRPVGIEAYSELPPTRNERLFSISDLTPDAESSIRLWLGLYPLIGEVATAYYRLLTTRQLDHKERLMLSVSALESFHREIIGGTANSEEAHEARMKALEVVVSDTGYWNWLRGKLRLSNEPSLEQRIRRLIKKIPKEIADVFSFSDDAKLAADTRNYHAHLLVSLRDRAATGEELFWVAEKMRVLLEILLMLAFGVREEALASRTVTNRRWFAVRDKIRREQEAAAQQQQKSQRGRTNKSL
jgi:hypothetical protein